MNRDMLKKLQKKIAENSIGASTAQKMGPSKTVDTARTYLTNLKLRAFAKPRREDFQRCLEDRTRRLQKRLHDNAKQLVKKKKRIPNNGRVPAYWDDRERYWGPARKFLNIFLRNVVYNRHLCEAYGLKHIEKWLEVPLDSQVGCGLRGEREAGGEDLRRWRGVVRLTPKKDGEYRKSQRLALKVAKRKETLRVHLDLLYFRPADGL
jgi:hypothetical protein